MKIISEMQFKHGNLCLEIFDFENLCKIWGNPDAKIKIYGDVDPSVARLHIISLQSESLPFQLPYFNMRLSELLSLEWILGHFISDLMKVRFNGGCVKDSDAECKIQLKDIMHE